MTHLSSLWKVLGSGGLSWYGYTLQTMKRWHKTENKICFACLYNNSKQLLQNICVVLFKENKRKSWKALVKYYSLSYYRVCYNSHIYHMSTIWNNYICCFILEMYIVMRQLTFQFKIKVFIKEKSFIENDMTRINNCNIIQWS